MKKNNGNEFELKVYNCVLKILESDSYVGKENIFFHKKYFSKDRNDYIETDISVEIKIQNILFLIVVIECKDYKTSLDVSEIEEFHSKLQQIGEDNTKGIIVTSNGKFKRAAISFSQSKGITLAKLGEDADHNNHAHYEDINEKKLIQLIDGDVLCSYYALLLNVPLDLFGIMPDTLNESKNSIDLEENLKKLNLENDVKVDQKENTEIETNNYLSDIFLNLVREIDNYSDCDMNFLRYKIKLLALME